MRVGKCTIRPGFFILLSIFALLDRENLAVYILAAVLLHEFAHWILLRIYGVTIQEVALSITGVEIKTGQQRLLGYISEILICLAGPAANLLAALLLALYGKRSGGSEPLYLFSGINLALGAFNLLPVEGLDGGRILTLLMEWAFEDGKTLVRAISILFSLLLILIGGYVFLATGFNLSLLAVGVFFLCKPGGGLKRN